MSLCFIIRVKKLSLGLTPFYTTSCINFEIQSEILFLLRVSILIDYRTFSILFVYSFKPQVLDLTFKESNKSLRDFLSSKFTIFSPLFSRFARVFLLLTGRSDSSALSLATAHFYELISLSTELLLISITCTPSSIFFVEKKETLKCHKTK